MICTRLERDKKRSAAGRSARSRERQIGREGDIARLAGGLLQGNHTVLADLRRTGKTTVALAALDVLVKDDKNVIAAVDLSRSISDGDALDAELAAQAAVNSSRAAKALRTAGGLATRLWKMIAAADVLDEDQEAVVAAARTDFAAAGDRAHGWPLDALAQLAADRGGRAIVFIDEAQRLADWEDREDVAAALLARMRDPESPITFLFAGSEPTLVETLFEDGGLLEHDALEFALSPIDRQPWREGLRRAFRELGVEITDEAVDLILDASGGHPHLTMLAANRTHEQLTFAELDTADPAVAAEGLRAAREQRLWDVDV